ncbi:hypothetical protein SFC66_12090 [Terribacillus saccharophilus]|uniref:hypothetical protein n=1 Tax=Terribacillus saccharophilus TaxID=361277 RepID=UPI003981EB5A
MTMELTQKEKKYMNDVIQELITMKATQEQIHIIKQQLHEHMEESRLHGIDPFEDLDTSAEFVKDYLEINKVQSPNNKNSILSKMHYLMGVSFFTITYLISQLILTMFLTQSFSPAYQNADFNYNILYSISDNLWWNTTLIVISLLSSIIITSLVGVYSLRRMNRF